MFIELYLLYFIIVIPKKILGIFRKYSGLEISRSENCDIRKKMI